MSRRSESDGAGRAGGADRREPADPVLQQRGQVREHPGCPLPGRLHLLRRELRRLWRPSRDLAIEGRSTAALSESGRTNRLRKGRSMTQFGHKLTFKSIVLQSKNHSTATRTR